MTSDATTPRFMPRRSLPAHFEPDEYLDNPENHLWLRHADRTLTVIERDRIDALLKGEAAQTPTEQLLSDNRDWLYVYLAQFRGEWPVTIDEGEPLPELHPENLPENEEED